MGEDPCQGVPQPDQPEDDDTASAGAWYSENVDVGENLHSLKLDAASRAIIQLGRRVDASNAEREGIARVLGDLARCANARGRLNVRTASAFKVVAESLDVSPQRLRAAVAAAIDGETPA